MKHFINLKDINKNDLKKILIDAKKRKQKRKNLNTLDVDRDSPLKGKLLIKMFEKSFIILMLMGQKIIYKKMPIECLDCINRLKCPLLSKEFFRARTQKTL